MCTAPLSEKAVQAGPASACTCCLAATRTAQQEREPPARPAAPSYTHRILAVSRQQAQSVHGAQRAGFQSLGDADKVGAAAPQGASRVGRLRRGWGGGEERDGVMPG